MVPYEKVKLSVIVPCYFINRELVIITQRCLDSLVATMPLNTEIIIVDDASPHLVEFDKHYKVVRRSENGGYPAAVNSGLQVATGNIIIVSNNDCEFIQEDWLTHLLKPLLEGYDICSIRTTDNTGYDVEDFITEGDNFGSIWAMRRSVYETLGGLDESFGKGTFEDQDYKQRAFGAGFKVAKNHAGLVEHIGRATFDTVDPSHATFARNQEIYRKKWGRVD